ncbi:hypothetical protein BDDG_06098 [Blastomyces dermatitidis ATCC 18188]|uniref:Uncharacterized protein n=1 Tax=Ajellomyces dermatitidis (strain ATCC 18188 / CBS 674.68) TaxID=653446 RepID=F2TIU1_AJEDA|nr:hypothetical protein BDDG_06098 [Blastomyces dermatitidis ATCC 18188]
MDAEMRYYGVPDSYQQSYQYYKDEYLCLWEVTVHEIVGHWQWDELDETSSWYEKIILPAFKNHNEIHLAGREVLDMLDLLDALAGSSTLFGNDRLSPCGSLYSGWHISSEEDNICFEDEYGLSDTDDEAEEPNLVDDMFKILEGDWL